MPPSPIRNTSVIPNTTFSPSLLTHSEDTQVKYVTTGTERPAAVLFPQQRIGRLLLCLVYLVTLFKLTVRQAPFCNTDEVMSGLSMLQWRLQINRYSFDFCVKRNFALFYGYFTFSQLWILLVEFKISTSLNNETI
jgi:hypothetical protein